MDSYNIFVRPYIEYTYIFVQFNAMETDMEAHSKRQNIEHWK